ncbi:procollagen-proline 4-dioxygenase [Aureococcus anophagefferens]|nr:procollagen-proline 4-dioxygenase [Aureococcus anophagefferens]
MLSRATTPMLPKFLLLVAATARGAGVSIVVRNLAGEDVVVSWLQPGREPRGRVPQQEKPLKNATTMSINSYETHEFIVASVAPAAAARGRARGADADDNCAFWASGTAEAQKATRRRSLEKRNASCAAHAGNSETVGTVEWTWPRWRRERDLGATRAAGPERARTVRHLFKPPAEPAALIAVVDDFPGPRRPGELMAVQYNPGQQLHCDGSCDGAFVAGGRLATVLMYRAPLTAAAPFLTLNVHVVPAKGQAVYFHFRGPEPDGVVEDWHTEHSGCPVRSGEHADGEHVARDVHGGRRGHGDERDTALGPGERLDLGGYACRQLRDLGRRHWPAAWRALCDFDRAPGAHDEASCAGVSVSLASPRDGGAYVYRRDALVEVRLRVSRAGGASADLRDVLGDRVGAGTVAVSTDLLPAALRRLGREAAAAASEAAWRGLSELPGERAGARRFAARRALARRSARELPVAAQRPEQPAARHLRHGHRRRGAGPDLVLPWLFTFGEDGSSKRFVPFGDVYDVDAFVGGLADLGVRATPDDPGGPNGTTFVHCSHHPFVDASWYAAVWKSNLQPDFNTTMLNLHDEPLKVAQAAAAGLACLHLRVEADWRRHAARSAKATGAANLFWVDAADAMALSASLLATTRRGRLPRRGQRDGRRARRVAGPGRALYDRRNATAAAGAGGWDADGDHLLARRAARRRRDPDPGRVDAASADVRTAARATAARAPDARRRAWVPQARVADMAAAQR